jgi:hypothetical protein
MITDILIKNKWKLGTAKNMQQLFCNMPPGIKKKFPERISNPKNFFHSLIKKTSYF